MENEEMRGAVERLACTAIKYAAGEFDPIEEFSEMIRFDANRYLAIESKYLHNLVALLAEMRAVKKLC